MKKHFLLCRFFLFSGNLILPFYLLAQSNPKESHGQKTDSFLIVLSHSREDTNKVNILDDLGWELINAERYDGAMKYSIMAEKLAEKIEYKKGVANALSNIGVVCYFLGNYSDALKNQLQSLKINEERGDSASIASCYNNLGLNYNAQGNYPEAIKNYLSALKISENSSHKNNIVDNYNNIAITYTNQKNYSEALKYFSQALSIYLRNNNKVSIANVYDNIGALYDMQGNYEQALHNIKQSLVILEEAGDTVEVAYNYNNIAGIYAKQGNYEDALKNYFMALNIWSKNGDKLGIAISYMDIGEIFTKQKKFNDAKHFLLDGLKIIKEIGAKDELKECYINLAKLSEAIGDYKNAYQYQKLFTEIKDSILNEENNKVIAEMKTKYETEKKEKEIEILNSNLETRNLKVNAQKTTIRYLIGGFFALLIFALIYFRLYNQKRKTLFQRQLLETELKALRSQMNPHFTFNVLNSIQYYVRANDMKSAENYLTKFSRLIRMILDQSRHSYISLQQEITMLKLYLELEQMLFEKKFNYSIEIDKSLETGRVQIPGMLIQPIVENSINHGLAHKVGEALISISFSSHNSVLLCSITDNGIGREAAERMKARENESVKMNDEESKEENVPFHQSAGIAIIKERMDALSTLYKIQLSYKTEDLFDSEGISSGTRVSIELPVKG